MASNAAAAPPGLVFLYDGLCRLCAGSARRMHWIARPGTLEMRDFQQPGALAPFPQVTFDQCMEAARLVDGHGHVWSGLDAVFRAAATRWFLTPLYWIYRIPPVRWLGDKLYVQVAENRYRWFGRNAPQCSDTGCQVHLRPPKPRPKPTA